MSGRRITIVAMALAMCVASLIVAGLNHVHAQTGGPVTVTARDPKTGGAPVVMVGNSSDQSIRTHTVGSDLPSTTVNITGGLNRPRVQFSLVGSLGQPLGDKTPLAVNVVSPPTDPCMDQTLLGSVAISQAANAQLLTVPAARRVFFCHFFVVGADAENISLVEGTGSTCATGTLAVIGGATAANGMNFAAGGGAVDGIGSSWIAKTAVPGNNVCLFQSASGRVAGVLKYALN
jgi:hypothetical protein